jgi:cobalt-zinc-cadmium efflux system protein
LLGHGAQDLNRRAAALHVLGDLLASIVALLSGLVIVFTGWTLVDPLLSLLIVAFILISTLRLLREALHGLMEGVPFGLSLEVIGADMAAVEGVESVHDLHVWSLSSQRPALSAHVMLADLGQWERVLAELRELLLTHHGIDHVTLQPETSTRVMSFVRPEHIKPS